MDNFNFVKESEEIQTNISRLAISFDSSLDISEDHDVESLPEIQCEKVIKISGKSLSEPAKFIDASPDELHNFEISFDLNDSEVKLTTHLRKIRRNFPQSQKVF